MTDLLRGKKIAILATNGFEQSELLEPKKALEEVGAIAIVISPEKNTIRGWQHDDWGDKVNVDLLLDQANVDDYDGLLLPGGVINPDKLRLNDKAIELIKQFHATDKPIAAICHGPWTLINAGIVKGRKLTSWPSIKLDLINAGANWVDAQVVVDGKLVTSRKPDDIPAFNAEMIKLFAKEPTPVV